LAPELVDVVLTKIQRARMVAQALDGSTWCRDIHGALTIHILIQYIHTRQRIQGFHLILGVANHFIWRWASLGSYSNVSPYGALFFGQTALLGAKELWKVYALNTCHFFIWLVLHGRC
jgi:hypothetical protein